jgi:uncharacterized protein (TIGR00251 family)
MGRAAPWPLRSDRSGAAITEANGAVRVSIFVQPRASRTEVVGEHGDAIKLRVAAPPVEGEANREVVRFLSKLLGIPLRSVELLSGETGRRKVVEVRGVTAEFVRSKLLA